MLPQGTLYTIVGGLEGGGGRRVKRRLKYDATLFAVEERGVAKGADLRCSMIK